MPKSAQENRPVQEAIRGRRSIKEFSGNEIPMETVEELLELALLAPNHRMTHPFEFLVLGPEARRRYGRIKGDRRARRIDDPEVADQVRGRTVEEEVSVPAVIGFVQRLDDDPEIREEDYATVYMGMQNFLLAAVERGLGTHVKTGAVLEDPKTREALGIPEGKRLVALVQLGEPREIAAAKPRPRAGERTRWLD